MSIYACRIVLKSYLKEGARLNWASLKTYAEMSVNIFILIESNYRIGIKVFL